MAAKVIAIVFWDSQGHWTLLEVGVQKKRPICRREQCTSAMRSHGLQFRCQHNHILQIWSSAKLSPNSPKVSRRAEICVESGESFSHH